MKMPKMTAKVKRLLSNIKGLMSKTTWLVFSYKYILWHKKWIIKILLFAYVRLFTINTRLWIGLPPKVIQPILMAPVLINQVLCNKLHCTLVIWPTTSKKVTIEMPRCKQSAPSTLGDKSSIWPTAMAIQHNLIPTKNVTQGKEIKIITSPA